mmetsp:Transcript_30754/g.108174  ORF Transcript_30754/g.108174 Transcript_30754/m.108174 type:complete len:379 (-) Transcript_30754:219-1355(-)
MPLLKSLSWPTERSRCSTQHCTQGSADANQRHHQPSTSSAEVGLPELPSMPSTPTLAPRNRRPSGDAADRGGCVVTTAPSGWTRPRRVGDDSATAASAAAAATAAMAAAAAAAACCGVSMRFWTLGRRSRSRPVLGVRSRSWPTPRPEPSLASVSSTARPSAYASLPPGPAPPAPSVQSRASSRLAWTMRTSQRCRCGSLARRTLSNISAQPRAVGLAHLSSPRTTTSWSQYASALNARAMAAFDSHTKAQRTTSTMLHAPLGAAAAFSTQRDRALSGAVRSATSSAARDIGFMGARGEDGGARGDPLGARAAPAAFGSMDAMHSLNPGSTSAACVYSMATSPVICRTWPPEKMRASRATNVSNDGPSSRSASRLAAA